MSKIKTAIYLIKNQRNIFFATLIEHIGFLFSDILYSKILFRLRMGYKLNLDNPKTYNEKLQWLKLYDHNPLYTTLVDKFAVKEYVAKKIGKEYIIPTLGVWDKPEDIDFDTLPNQFVLKTTHGGGNVGVVICKDKSKLDKQLTVKKLKKAMKQNLYKESREWPYKNVPKRIIAEKFMAERTVDGKAINKDLPDYKFYCFDGEPKYCQVIRDRRTKETIDFYDMEWNHMLFVGLNPVVSNGLTPVARPENLEDMKRICHELAKDMPFVRIDLYAVNSKEYFGEITFYPASGYGSFTPEEWNTKLGDLVKLKGEYGGGTSV